ncbi:hypothetical protein ACFL2M_02175 [Patescibacteria group bacterium]
MQPITFANRKKTPTHGYLMLVSVLVVGAVGVSIAVSLLLLGLGSTRTSFTTGQAEEANALADACAERGLNDLRADPTYTGGDTYSLGNGSCDVVDVAGSGTSNRTVQATGTIGNITRKVEVEVATVASPMTITSWQEVADF